MQRFITTSQAAKILNVSDVGVRAMANRGALPVATTTESGTRLFDRQQVEQVAAQRIARTNSDEAA